MTEYQTKPIITSSTPSLRAKTYQLLESDSHRSVIAKTVNILLIILIVTNVLAAMFESEPAYHEAYLQEFALFELISLSIFCFEYILRVWCCVKATEYKKLSSSKARLKYCTSPIALIDLIALLPFLIAMFFTIDLRLQCGPSCTPWFFRTCIRHSCFHLRFAFAIRYSCFAHMFEGLKSGTCLFTILCAWNLALRCV